MAKSSNQSQSTPAREHQGQMEVAIQRCFSARTARLKICSLHHTDGCLYNALLPAHEVPFGVNAKKVWTLCTLHFPDYFPDPFQMQQLDTLWKSEVSKLIWLSFSPWALAHRGRQSFQRIPESRWLIGDPKPCKCSRKRYKNIEIGKERIPWISLDVVEVTCWWPRHLQPDTRGRFLLKSWL